MSNASRIPGFSAPGTDGTRSGARFTPLSERGEPAMWLMGMGLCLCALLILGLLSLVAAEGMSTFWPRPIDLVTLRSGEKFLGIQTQSESFTATEADRAAIEALRSEGRLPPGALDPMGNPVRRLYRVGNRELTGTPFRWTSLYEIASVERPKDAVMLERREWGVWLGVPRAIVRIEDTVVSSETAAGFTPGETRDGEGRRVVSELRTDQEGRPFVRRKTYVVEGDGAFDRLASDHAESVERFAAIESIREHDVGIVNHRIESERLRVREAELTLEDKVAGRLERLGTPAWIGVIVAAALAALGARALRVRPGSGVGVGSSAARWRGSSSAALWCVAAGAALLAIIESPWMTPDMTPERLERIRAEAGERQRADSAQYEEILTTLRTLESKDAAFRAEIVEPTTGRFAPTRQTALDDPALVSQIVRIVPANELSFGGKVGVYLSRWAEFLTADPRDTNTAGGVFPVIFGTVLLTLLLSVVVVPFGVVAALYLREYARQGTVTSLIRIAVNNLAGVPSIVYGVFGFGFFCYTLGKYIDSGPADPFPRYPWWFLLGSASVVIAAALTLAVYARPTPGQEATRAQRWLRSGGILMWFVSAALVVALFATTPYFHGFFRASLPSPTYGGPGLLWGAATLALLTLPVVIVATEEAVGSVPGSMREGSYGCGASKWQTLWRLVIPGAAPGIMTGMILAMARGAGEVAPLMLVGAVKLAPELPFGGEWPFIHPERKFMHLGFHIYDLGFQSPDAEAARPLVWTTTLLLVAVVLLMNLTAITIRARLKAKYSANQF